jgi:hypothetical protein
MRIILVLSILLTGAALAAEVTLEPHVSDNNDATICQNAPDWEYGAEWQLWAGHWLGHVDFLIQFYELDDYLDVDLMSATLKLYNEHFSGGPPVQATVYRIKGEWDEADVTWNTNPGYNADIGDGFNITADHVWYDVDVTDIVQSWIDGDMDHYGFYIRNSVQEEKVAYIMSGDYFLDYSLSPKLTLVYTGSEVQEASWGEIKASF